MKLKIGKIVNNDANNRNTQICYHLNKEENIVPSFKTFEDLSNYLLIVHLPLLYILEVFFFGNHFATQLWPNY